MKKLFACFLLAGLLVTTVGGTALAVNANRGGGMGFVAGCCFGIRAGAAYNDGKDIHWREWLTLTGVGAVWNGIEAAKGMQTSDYVKAYGSAFY
jgi:hypothetical protein